MKPSELKTWTIGPEQFYSNEEEVTVLSPEDVAAAIDSAMEAAIQFAEFRGPTPDYDAWLARIEELREGK